MFDDGILINDKLVTGSARKYSALNFNKNDKMPRFWWLLVSKNAGGIQNHQNYSQLKVLNTKRLHF